MTQTDRSRGLVPSAAVKIPVKAATTAAITLSGTQTIDGIACVAGDRVLVKNQASAIANGLYTVDTGDWVRTDDFDGALDAVKGTLIIVPSGTVNGPSFWQVTTENSVDIGTDSIDFALRVNALSGVSAFVQTLLDDSNSTAFVQTLGSSSVYSVLGVSTVSQTLLGSTGLSEFREALGSHNAANLTTGTIGSPVAVPLGRFTRGDDVNSASPTTITSTSGIMVSQSLGSVSSGDRILCYGSITAGIKSGAAGLVELQLSRTGGTANGVFNSIDAAVFDSQIVTSGSTAVPSLYQRSLHGMFRVTAGGTFTLGLTGISSGSNVTGVTANISGLVLRGSS